MAMDINTYVAQRHLSPLIDQVNAARFASRRAYVAFRA